MQRSLKVRCILSRKYSKAVKFSASDIRKTFIEYFANEHAHKIVKSSSVKPHNDPSLAFVNAGMNQFKSVLLGTETPIAPRVVNSQKCIRVGGKHNDLEAVGSDGTHHTFFEMLGNWSFADYFKEDACKFAWKLLTGPYGFDKNKLVVTYFGGHSKSNLIEDKETADIWRQIGLVPNQIIPNGMEDNFWEMGPTGPCGPCTEIYYVDGRNITELWNLVFIEQERKVDRLLYPLKDKHVDTGMGLERLTRALQGVNSNYDTDLFLPLIHIIEKSSGMDPYRGSFSRDAVCDTAYRILADHSRAISISLADGIFPEQNYKLRKLIRKCFSLSENIFKKNGNELLCSLIQGVTENLGCQYIELHSNLRHSLEIVKIEYESFLLSSSQSQAEWKKLLTNYPSLHALPSNHPGLPQAVNEVKDLQEISGSLAFRLHDTLGLDLNVIQQLAKCFNLQVDVDGFQTKMIAQQKSSRAVTGAHEKVLTENHIPPTSDQSKYFWEYNKGHYKFSESLNCKILALLTEDGVIEKASVGEECHLITDNTHLYHEAGGQTHDIGTVETKGGSAVVIDVQRHGKYVLHKIRVLKGEITKESPCKLSMDVDHRLKCMKNHSATHLLNAALHEQFDNTSQRSSHVTADYLTFDFSTKAPLKEEQLKYIEEFVKDKIQLALPIKKQEMKFSNLPYNAIKIPGEDYPENVNVITIGKENFISVEPCCGTHCNNTRDIKEFCITAEKSAGAGVRSLRALTGELASSAVQLGIDILDEIHKLQEFVSSAEYNSIDTHYTVKTLKQKIEESEIPILRKRSSLEMLEVVDKKVSGDNKIISREIVERYIKALIASAKTPFITSVISSSSPEKLNLMRANSLCLPERASLFLALDGDGYIRGRCTVPEDMASESFNAEVWMAPVLKTFNAEGGSPKGKDSKLVFLMKPIKMKKDHARKVTEIAIRDAENFARASLLLSVFKRNQ